jgi:hypothetical protein
MTRTVLFCCLFLIAITNPAPCQMGWCWGQDYFRTSVETGVVTIIHESALYNCCPDSIVYAIAQDANQISVVETEVVSIPCACLCCYSLPVAVGPLPAGQYQIDFSWHDETGARHAYLDVTVPEWGGRGTAPHLRASVDHPPCQQTPPVAFVPGPAEGDPPLPEGTALASCYPNPSRGEVTVRYTSAQDERLRIVIFGPGGDRVRDLFDGPVHTGSNDVVWDGRNEAGSPVPAGVYCCRLDGESGSALRRLIIIR